MRFYLIDRIEEIRYGDYATAVKCVTLSEEIFNEHFPGHPIFPGSLLMEGMAQLAGSLFELTMRHREEPMLRAVLSLVNRLKFRRPVVPGDRVLIRATITSMHTESGMAKVKAEVDGTVCSQGELMFTFHDIANPLLQDEREDLYRCCMRNTRVVE